MKGFARWLVRHRGLVILVCLVLMIPSVLGMAATKTKYDLLYYLPQELETVQGQEILLQDFGKGAFSLLITEGMPLKEQEAMENAVREIPHVESVIGYASITKRRAAGGNHSHRLPGTVPAGRLHAVRRVL